jgi:hypothetical protein
VEAGIQSFFFKVSSQVTLKVINGKQFSCDSCHFIFCIMCMPLVSKRRPSIKAKQGYQRSRIYLQEAMQPHHPNAWFNAPISMQTPSLCCNQSMLPSLDLLSQPFSSEHEQLTAQIECSLRRGEKGCDNWLAGGHGA